MKYYQNRNTEEIIGVENTRELITHSTEQSLSLGFKGYSCEVVYDMICPNKLLGNGIKTYCITHSFLKENYKRIKIEIALNKYPRFKQYRHKDLLEEGKKLNIDTLNVLKKQTF
jgi:hypothetical protein